jgi:hypothetical protein
MRRRSAADPPKTLKKVKAKRKPTRKKARSVTKRRRRRQTREKSVALNKKKKLRAQLHKSQFRTSEFGKGKSKT